MTSAHLNAQLIETLYTALQRRDGAAMAACYHPDARFSDPVFPDLQGPRAGAMWKMLCERASTLVVEFRDVAADDHTGRAHWEAKYLFSATGRHVHNVIEATFEFRDGLIARHIDRFDLWKWSGMALGGKGKLLGWAPFVHRAIRKQAARGLQQFEAGAAGAPAGR